VGAESRPHEVIIYVADRGPGLSPGQEDAVFQKFHRGGAGTGGIGLGLTICRGIVTAHGGKIELESSQGVGTSVRISLEAAPHPSD